MKYGDVIMKNRWPSLGCIYLAVSITCCGLFICWATNEGWYHRIRTPNPTGKDLERWASYLEKVAIDFPSNKKRVEFYKEAAEIRSRLGQSEKVLIDLKRASLLSPADNILKAQIAVERYKIGQLKQAGGQAKNRFDDGRGDGTTLSIKQIVANKSVIMLGFSGDGWTLDGKPGYLFVTGSGEKGVSQEVGLACYADKKDLPLTVTIEGGDRKLSHTFRRAERVNIRLPKVDSGKSGLFVVKTNKTWIPSGRDDRKLGVRGMISGLDTSRVLNKTHIPKELSSDEGPKKVAFRGIARCQVMS